MVKSVPILEEPVLSDFPSLAFYFAKFASALDFSSAAVSAAAAMAMSDANLNICFFILILIVFNYWFVIY